ncbi:MAG: hypothetical protein U0903_14635 [Planctomycetales bacterium]
MLLKTLRRGRMLALGLLLTSVGTAFGEGPQGRAGYATLEDEPDVAQFNSIVPTNATQSRVMPTNYSCPVPAFGTVQPQFGPSVAPQVGAGPYGPDYATRRPSERGYVTFNEKPGGRCCGPRGAWYNAEFWGNQTSRFRCRNQVQSQRLANGLGCTFAFASPLLWWDAGARKDIIAVNPGYSDPRDSELYSAQGYGVPIAVPLAPVVRDTYNYGWGMPASRLTPVATHAVP